MLLDQISIHSWINNNAIKTEAGHVLDFHNHRYLFDIYRDNSPLLCCTKAGQIGFSTMAILKTVWLAYNKKMRIGYVLPTADMSNKFVSSKVNPISQQNKIIASWMRDKDAVEQKQIGQGFIHFVGAQTPTAAIMLTMDMLILDEYDKARQDILEMFNSRLQHSEYKWKWIFSNPTMPDFGVDRFWQISDQKKWHIKHSCGEIYVLDENCIDYSTEVYRCPHCKLEITNEERRMGEWVATATGEWSGYWIPLWINPKVTAKEIAQSKRTSTAEYFSNFVAGLPYIGSDNSVAETTITKNIIDKVNDQSGRIIIGVDTGLPIHYVLGNKQGLFYHGTCEPPSANYDPYDHLEKYLIRWPNSIMIADQGGDLIGIRKLQAKYPGRVFLCWFRKDQKTQQLIKWGEGVEYGKVIVDRNRTIQFVIDELKDSRLPIYGKIEDWKPYVQHWMNIYRIKDVEDENEPTYGWEWVWKRKGPDHWMMCTIYWRVGMEKFAESLATIIGADPLDGIPVGRIFQD